MVLFGQKWLYSCKRGSIWAKVVVFEQKCFYSGVVLVFGQSVSIRERGVVFWQKWLYSGKSGCVRVKVGVFGRKWLYWGKSGCIGAKLVVFG